MKSKAIFLVFSLCLFSEFALAKCAGKACTKVYVERLYLQATGSVYVGTTGKENLLNCTAVSDIYLTLDPNDKNADYIYSTLLAAQMEDKKVHLRIADNSSNCKLQFVSIDRQ